MAIETFCKVHSAQNSILNQLIQIMSKNMSFSYSYQTHENVDSMSNWKCKCSCSMHKLLHLELEGS